MDWLAPVDAYCERTGPEYWSEPVNALTNLAFLLAALVMARRLRGPGLATGRVLAGVLFTLGALTVLLRRNAIIELMGVELMLNAVNLVLVTFSRIHGNLTGQVFAFFVMVVAAAEVVVGLSIVVSIFRTRRSTSVDDENLLKN